MSQWFLTSTGPFAVNVTSSGSSSMLFQSQVSNVCDDISPSSQPPPYYPAHFAKGSTIQLATGELKPVEDLTTEDFIHCAECSPDLCLDTSTVLSMTPLANHGTVMLEFSIGQNAVKVSVESTVEHPFFVYNRGWSSYNPARTVQRYKLSCCQLQVGDKCISLTQKDSTHNVNSTRTQVSSHQDPNGFESSRDYFVSGSASLNPRMGRSRLASDSVFQVHRK